jgi:hypothetical protein
MSQCTCGHDIDDHDVDGIRACQYSICDCAGFKLYISKEDRARIEELEKIRELYNYEDPYSLIDYVEERLKELME